MEKINSIPEGLDCLLMPFPAGPLTKSYPPKWLRTGEVDDNIMEKDGLDVEIADEDLKNALMLVPNADDYDTWLKVGFALHHHFDGSQEGLDFWHEWSETADNYDPEVLNSKWPTLSVRGKDIKAITALYILKVANAVSKKLNREQRRKINRVGGDIALLEKASEILPVAVTWLWLYWIAVGKLSLIAGAPGTGKTTLALAISAIVSRGGSWPDGTKSPKGIVVIWSSEDDKSDTLIPRLIANGANLENIRFLSSVNDTNGDHRPFDPAEDTEALVKSLRKLEGVKLIVIDPIVSAVAGDSHKNAEVRRALQPIVDLANEIGAAIIGITHFTKGTGGKDLIDRFTASIAFIALARTALATAIDAINGGYVLTRAKSNLGPIGGGYRYEIEQVILKEYPEITASKVIWGEVLEGSAKELIKDAEAENVKPNHEGSVEEWLSKYLTNGPMLANDIIDFGKLDGFSRDRLNRAKDKLGIKSKRDGFGGAWWWLLDGQEIPRGEDDDL